MSLIGEYCMEAGEPTFESLWTPTGRRYTVLPSYPPPWMNV